MATEQEIAERKAALLAAVAKRDWESAGKRLAWLVQNITDSQLLVFFPELLAAFDKAMGNNCKDSIAFTMRGSVKMGLEKGQEAIADFDKAVELNPDDVNAFFHRASAKITLGNNQEVIADLDNVIRLKPDYPGAYNNRGIINGSLGNFQAAIADFNKEIQLNPNSASAFHHRGIIYGSLGNPQAAIADLDKAIQLNPNSANFYDNRGVAKGSLNKHQEAIADFDKAIQLNPEDANIYHNRGASKGSLGNHRDAIADFNKAIEIDPNRAHSYHNRGLAKFNMAKAIHKERDDDLKKELDRAGVVDDFRQALRLDPSEIRIRQLEEITLLVASLNKNIEFGKEELDRRRRSHEKKITPFLRVNYFLATLPLIILPVVFLVLLYFIDFYTIKKMIKITLSYFGKLPLSVYIMSGIGLFSPVIYFSIQIFFIHRLEYRTHQSKFPLQELTINEKSIYGDSNQSMFRISPAEVIKVAAPIITTTP